MDEKTSRALAVRLLARREHAAAELMSKLTRRGCNEALAAAVVRWCAEHDLQSDRRFAEQFTRQRAGRCYGPRRIRAELAARGVADDEIEAALADAACDWVALARRWARKKPVDLDDYQQRGRLQQALLRRGFNGAQAARAIREARGGDPDG